MTVIKYIYTSNSEDDTVALKRNGFKERWARNGSKVTWLNKVTFCSSYPLFKKK